jgi:hypothetical protein
MVVLNVNRRTPRVCPTQLEPMVQRFLGISSCTVIAFAMAMAMSLVTYLAYWPPRWKRLDPELLTGFALLGGVYIAAIPLLALGLMSLRRIPAVLSVSVTSSWLLGTFLILAKKPWLYYGDFPWWMLLRDFVQPLPVSLAVGLAFAVCARKVLGRPDISRKLKPTRLV